MPVTRIAIREGKTPEYKQALMDEIYEAMRETVAIKNGDRFMTITEHGEDEFAYGPFLGIDRSDDLVQIPNYELAMYSDRRATRRQPGSAARGADPVRGRCLSATARRSSTSRSTVRPRRPDDAPSPRQRRERPWD